MGAILKIEGQDIEFKFKQCDIREFVMLRERPGIMPGTFVRYPVGKRITMVTSNMPEPLLNEIKEVIARFCNH